MVINACLLIIKLFLQALLAGLEIITLPAKFGAVVLVIIAKLAEGMSIINAYIDTVYIGALFAVVVSVMALINSWRVIRWILKKIPFLGID